MRTVAVSVHSRVCCYCCVYVCACARVSHPQQGRIALHPSVFMRLATAADDLPSGVDRANTLIVHRVVVATDVSDFNSVDTSLIIEASLKLYSAQPGNAHITTAAVKTDMAADYSGVITPLVLFSKESFVRAGGKIRVPRILHSEPGEGKVSARFRFPVGGG